MSIEKIDKTKDFHFIEAWEKAIDNSDVIITSKKSEISYKIDMSKNGNKLIYFNPVIDSWQTSTYMLPEEIFDAWYVTK